MANQRPSKVTICTYQVGFGDCFLLSFHYPNGQKHLVIDCGSTRLPKGAKSTQMVRIAEDIKQRVGNDLVAVVATHRHKDHISGFATAKNGKASGDIIRSCKPKLVLMPWTEQPDLARDALEPTAGGGSKAFAQGLMRMQDVSASALRFVERWEEKSLGPTYAKEIKFIADDNLANKSAVENLATMGQALYLYYGKRPTALERLLPGVRVSVLGPPTLKQTRSIEKQCSRDQDEFWHLQGLASEYAAAPEQKLFPRYATYSTLPPDSRWFCERIDGLMAHQLLGIVRSLDQAMNNTSLILLFQIGDKRLLFPGDAQIESWQYALRDAKEAKNNRQDLAATDVYKVGHHGSLNATPHTLWNSFTKRSTKKGDQTRLKSVMSTLPGVHGATSRKTEVPRRTLVEELDKQSTLVRTDEYKKGELVTETTVDL